MNTEMFILPFQGKGMSHCLKENLFGLGLFFIKAFPRNAWNIICRTVGTVGTEVCTRVEKVSKKQGRENDMARGDVFGLRKRNVCLSGTLNVFHFLASFTLKPIKELHTKHLQGVYQ